MSRRILFIDDDNILRKVYAERFRSDGFSVDEAGTAVDGFEKAKSGSYDILVADIRMPDMDGITMIKTIRQHEAELAASDPRYESRVQPIILVTASAQDEERKEALAVGATAYFGKDVTTPKVLSDWLQKFFTP